MISFVSVFLRLKKIASNLLRGFAMGIADVVPGVSGGTIALVLGIYEQLLENISNCALSLGKILKADFSGATWIDGKTICAKGSIGQCQ